jgi:hypothetical protein
MLTVHATTFDPYQRIVRQCPSALIRVGRYVDDHWGIIHPPAGIGFCPVATYQGTRADAERVLGPIVDALRRGDATAALAAALGPTGLP